MDRWAHPSVSSRAPNPENSPILGDVAQIFTLDILGLTPLDEDGYESGDRLVLEGMPAVRDDLPPAQWKQGERFGIVPWERGKTCISLEPLASPVARNLTIGHRVTLYNVPRRARSLLADTLDNGAVALEGWSLDGVPGAHGAKGIVLALPKVRLTEALDSHSLSWYGKATANPGLMLPSMESPFKPNVTSNVFGVTELPALAAL